MTPQKGVQGIDAEAVLDLHQKRWDVQAQGAAFGTAGKRETVSVDFVHGDRMSLDDAERHPEEFQSLGRAQWHMSPAARRVRLPLGRNSESGLIRDRTADRCPDRGTPPDQQRR